MIFVQKSVSYKYRKKTKPAKRTSTGEKRSAKLTDDIYISFIKDLAEKNSAIKPAEALKITISNFPLTDHPNRLTDRKINK